jgi:hypothetical protein
VHASWTSDGAVVSAMGPKKKSRWPDRVDWDRELKMDRVLPGSAGTDEKRIIWRGQKSRWCGRVEQNADAVRLSAVLS